MNPHLSSPTSIIAVTTKQPLGKVPGLQHALRGLDICQWQGTADPVCGWQVAKAVWQLGCRVGSVTSDNGLVFDFGF